MDSLTAVHTCYHIQGLSLRCAFSFQTLSGHITLFGADSVGAKFPAVYQLTPAEFAGTSVLQTHKMGNWAHKCLFALQFGICIHSDGFFHVQMRGTQEQNGCPQVRGVVPLKTHTSFQSPAENVRNARKTGREWMYHHLASQVQSPVPKAPATPVPSKRISSQSFFFFSFPITKDLGEVSQNQLANINTTAVMNVRSVYIVTVFGIL